MTSLARFGISAIEMLFRNNNVRKQEVQITGPSCFPSEPVNRSSIKEPMIIEIEVVCPSCSNTLVAPVDMAGQDATCEGCRTVIRIPAISVSETLEPSYEVPKQTPYQPQAPRLSLSLLKKIEWKRFEQLTEAYFQHMGWRTKLARCGADGGVDIRLYKASGSEVSAIVQCKAWNTYKVGIKPVRELFGVMAAERVQEGFFVTTGIYTDEARAFSSGIKMVLIDGMKFISQIEKLPDDVQARLHKLAIEGDYLTPTCPRCGSKMIRRIAQKGRGTGGSFWGCPGYPKCRQTLTCKEEGRSELPGHDEGD